MNEIMDFIYDLLPADMKHRGNGWSYFNCPMCKYTEKNQKKKKNVRKPAVFPKIKVFLHL